MKSEMNFKINQRAWSNRHGWGTIVRVDPGTKQNIRFRADNMLDKVCYFDADGRWLESDLYPTLFHKEQVFDYSEPDFPKGTLGYFWDDSMKDRALFGFYSHKSDRGHHYSMNGPEYKNFCPYPQLPVHLKDKLNKSALFSY